MARKTQAEAEKTRLAMIQAGTKHFAEQGYSGGALADLLEIVGVTRGALYHHFGSKQGFFEAVVESVQQALSAKILASSGRVGDGWQGIHAGCAAFLGAATDPVYRQVVLLDGPSALGWQRWKQLDDEHLTSALREGLNALDEAGQLDGGDAEALAVALSGAMNELALWVAHHHKPRAALKRARAMIERLIEASRSSAMAASL